MVRINTSKEVVEIRHPKYNDLVVRAYVLEPMEAMDLFSRMQKYQRVVVLQHPTKKDVDGNPEILTDELGNPLTHTLGNLPAKAVLDVLEGYLESWAGLEDSAGKPIPFARENFKYLFAPELNCETTRKDPKTQKDVKGTQSFGDYIQEVLNKQTNLSQVDNDPKTSN